MEQSTRITPFREPWNKGKLVGQKAPNFELADTACRPSIIIARMHVRTTQLPFP